ncbi:MAG TPA: Asp-tRNA(Asn)/Glu-tRNA(Gln) amidotransferase GatCAB subunit B, partial [Afifellaceae bacterium]|nr:Asp-tRNA(Asn)/Glu-tRNA(Gln) amidotransferase GatCAB subunit B [Afifellaceae bacterium]
DPDLLPLEFDEAAIAALADGLPELPDDKKRRFMAELGLSAYDSSVLVAEKEMADYFEAMLTEGAEPKAAANWLVNEHLGRLNREGMAIADAPVSASANGAIVQMITAGDISGKIGKQVYDIIWTEGGGDPRAIVEERGLKQVTDAGAITAIVDEVVAANAEKAAEAKANPRLVGWFVGQVMKASGGKANPQAVNQVLREKLGVE